MAQPTQGMSLERRFPAPWGDAWADTTIAHCHADGAWRPGLAEFELDLIRTQTAKVARGLSLAASEWAAEADAAPVTGGDPAL